MISFENPHFTCGLLFLHFLAFAQRRCQNATHLSVGLGGFSSRDLRHSIAGHSMMVVSFSCRTELGMRCDFGLHVTNQGYANKATSKKYRSLTMGFSICRRTRRSIAACTVDGGGGSFARHTTTQITTYLAFLKSPEKSEEICPNFGRSLPPQKVKYVEGSLPSRPRKFQENFLATTLFGGRQKLPEPRHFV